MAFNESWHVRSRGRECAATQKTFIAGEPIITALFPDPESSGYLRKDFCITAWQTRDPILGTPFSFWKSLFTAAISTSQPNHAEKLSAEEFLRSLVDEDEEHTENTRYILAIMLERQKLLRETDHQRTPHGILRVYEHRKTGEVFIVRDPDIPLSQVEAIQNEVFALLENQARRPADAEIPVTDAADASSQRNADAIS
jgi:hypothetical protein